MLFQADGTPFHCTRVIRQYEVRPIIQITTSVRPSASSEQAYIVGVEVENITGSSNIEITQLSTMSALWSCKPLQSHASYVHVLLQDFDYTDFYPSTSIPPRQVVQFSLGASSWQDGEGASETEQFVAEKLQSLLAGDQVPTSDPPPISLTCTHVTKVRLSMPHSTLSLTHAARRTRASSPSKHPRPVTSSTAGGAP